MLFGVDTELYDCGPDMESRRDCHGEDCDDHFWENSTDFNGLRVSEEILKEVYECKRESIDWTKGGRDLELPDAAWKVLLEWERETRLRYPDVEHDGWDP